MRRSRPLVLSLLWIAGGMAADPVPPEAPPVDPEFAAARARFRAVYDETPRDAWRERALRALDPGEEIGRTLLYEVLREPNWAVRVAAASRLASSALPAAREAFRRDLAAHADPLVREGIAFALASSLDPLDRDALRAAARGDADWRVRRTAVHALSCRRIPETVEALLEIWRAEEGREGGAHPRVRPGIREALLSLCGEDAGATPAAWSAWWEGHASQFVVADGAGEMQRVQVGGVWLEVQTPSLAGSAERPVVYVLPEYGLNANLYRPYLEEMSAAAQFVYVDLPRVVDFDRLYDAREVEFGHPVYPTGALVRALEAFRRDRGHGRVVILAHGVTAYVAAQFARENPEAVRGLVLVSALSGDDAYLRGLLSLRTSERLTLEQREHIARRILRPGEAPPPVLDPESDLRAYFTIYFRDMGDLELAWRCGPCLRNLGMVQFPPGGFRRGEVPEVPTLLATGAHGVLGTPGDTRRIESAFGRRGATTVRFEESGRAPFLEEPAAFREAFLEFLSGLPPPPGPRAGGYER